MCYWKLATIWCSSLSPHVSFVEQTNSFGEKETGIMLRFCAEKRERRGGANAQKGAKRGNKICRDNINLSKVSCISIHCILVYSKYINMCTCMYLYKYLYTWRWIKVWLSGYYYLAAVTSDQSELAHLHLSIISFTYKESNNNNQTILVDEKHLKI